MDWTGLAPTDCVQRGSDVQARLSIKRYAVWLHHWHRRRCGNRNCHCHCPGEAEHGPYYRLTRKVDGKTVTETLSSPPALAKAQHEVAKYQAANSSLPMNAKRSTGKSRVNCGTFTGLPFPFIGWRVWRGLGC